MMSARRVSRRTTVTLAGALAVLIATASPGGAAPGDLDPTFDADGKVTTDFRAGVDGASSLAIQRDGKIVAVGSAQFSASVRDETDFALARYNPGGSLDPTFGSDGMVTTDFAGTIDEAGEVAIQSDGKIVVAGSAAPTNAGPSFALARYNSDGSLDSDFGGDGKVTTPFGGGYDAARGVAIQSDGKIVAAGFALVFAQQPPDFALARYNLDGSLDPTFGGDGMVTTDFTAGRISIDVANAVGIQSDGKLVAAGTHGADFALARYTADGSLDPTFDGDGKVTTDFAGGGDIALALAIQGDGKVVVVGSSPGSPPLTNADFALARYNPDGSLDMTFDGDGMVRTDFAGAQTADQARAVVVQRDGKIVAAGGSGLGFSLARYNPDGSLDPTFSGDGKVTTDFAGGGAGASGVANQGDGKIVAAGTAFVPPEASDFALARYQVCRRPSSGRSSIPCR